MGLDKVPQPGDNLTLVEIEEIFESISFREASFPDESRVMGLAIVLLNFGDRYSPARCINGEWSGFKRDLPKSGGLPKCPNGHVLTQGRGLTLGWIEETL